MAMLELVCPRWALESATVALALMWAQALALALAQVPWSVLG